MSVRRNNNGVPDRSGLFRQVQRMGNPLINELIIGTGSKDRFSMDQPANDAQFVNFFADPSLPRVLNALTGGVLAIPAAPRFDLRPLVQYVPPIAAAGTPTGPIADLLRLNTGVPPTPVASASRLGVLGGDQRRLPQRPARVRRRHRHRAARRGRRRAGRAVPRLQRRTSTGGWAMASTSTTRPYQPQFPYIGYSPSGRDRRHIDPTEPGCTAGGGAPCPGL